MLPILQRLGDASSFKLFAENTAEIYRSSLLRVIKYVSGEHVHVSHLSGARGSPADNCWDIAIRTRLAVSKLVV